LQDPVRNCAPNTVSVHVTNPLAGNNSYEILGFHGGDDIDDVLGLGAVWTGW
jgi:hypothetical protein